MEIEKQAGDAGGRIVHGAVTGYRVDAAALGLPPLALHQRGEWDPAKEYWREEGDPEADWEKDDPAVRQQASVRDGERSFPARG